MLTKKGISAAPGVAIGPALVLDTEEYRIPRRQIDPSLVPGQLSILETALETARQEVADLRLGATRKLGEKTAAIFAFHEEFIADPKLAGAVRELIESRRFTAAYAFEQFIRQQQKLFQSVPDAYLKERVRDLYDIQKRVLRHILGRARETLTKLTEPVVIVAHDITPSQAVSLDREMILGIAINVGGSTSHTAIIARMLGIPSVVALNSFTSDVSGGERVIVDGTHGIVVAEPDDATVRRYQRLRDRFLESQVALRELRDLPAETTDGLSITLLGNIEVPGEAESAIEIGATGVGLYRTEFLFLGRTQIPTEEEQYEAYCEAIDGVGDRPITFRTLDLGADKLPEILEVPDDDNPVLGLRSLRYCLRDMDLFKTHLRALLRAAVKGDARLMFPMLTTLTELRQAKHIVRDVMEDLDEEQIEYRADLPIGVMVETPAAAIMADAFAREVDFLSIGTNDLTQYVLAVDRGNERVAHLYNAHSPAIVRLLKSVIDAGRKAQIDVSLCGEMAGSPLYTSLLIGLGLRVFSMAPQDIGEVKKLIRLTTLPQCEAIAQHVLEYETDRQVLTYLRDAWHKLVPEDVSG